MSLNFRKSVKSFLAFSLLVFTAESLFAFSVDETELKTVSDKTIVFENYAGPHDKIDTLDEIKGIGTVIASEIDITKNSTSGNENKYYVIHAYNEDDTKLSADIFCIGKDALVDHITNLRHIIASYLSKAYSYNYDDAMTIATFVTVYNAVYRGNIEYFSEKFSEEVIKNLSKEKLGISISYKEWAGLSELVIPVSDINGGISTIDTSVISDKNVVESMQEEDSKGIDERKNMVDLKEREADLAEEKAQESQKQATVDEDQLKKDKKESAQNEETAKKKEAVAEQKQKEADDAVKYAKEHPEDKAAQEKAKQKTKEAEAAKTEAKDARQKADESKKKVETQQKKAEKSKQESQKQQAKADKKQAEAQKERSEIAKDQKEVIKEKTEEETKTVYGLKLVDEKELLSAIVKINKDTGKEIRTSPVKVIRNRTVFLSGNNFVCIAGTKDGNGAVKLVLIDKDNLEITGESQEKVYENSVLVSDGKDFYCIIEEEKSFYAAKFDESLKLKAKSKEEVKNATPIFVSSEGVFVTDTKNKVIKLEDF